ncbi:hypothetical protein FHS67_001228 [Aminobacter aminovorans]|nr:hypothetical protein [Aminobacter aminovorans]
MSSEFRAAPAQKAASVPYSTGLPSNAQDGTRSGEGEKTGDG